ncbi:hypothetical protein PISMIDRAFT_275636 [Pisolithus microcarpus 441]|uniref:Uncharacterized protein n=1 Tax=Pisolithus microcarpus 441 TaxID=765257 RepID=A0A0C9YHP2_9AGAM|nr:hypothetical protein PISMIDRAFT_275636 [Pisolithus microcarpus 441]
MVTFNWKFGWHYFRKAVVVWRMYASRHPSDFHSTRQSFREEVIPPVVTFRLPGFFSTSLTPKVHGYVHDQGVSRARAVISSW